MRARCRLRARLRRTCAPCGRNPLRRRGRTSRRGRWHGCQVERHAVAAGEDRHAVAIGKPRARTSRRRRVHPLDVAGSVFILSPSPSRSPGRSASRRREDRHARERLAAVGRCPARTGARRKMNGGLGARINTGLPVVLARRRRQWCAGFHARVPCPWGQCGVPRLLAASNFCARVNLSAWPLLLGRRVERRARRRRQVCADGLVCWAHAFSVVS